VRKMLVSLRSPRLFRESCRRNHKCSVRQQPNSIFANQNKSFP